MPVIVVFQNQSRNQSQNVTKLTESEQSLKPLREVEVEIISWKKQSRGSVNPFVLAQQSCSEVFLLLDKKFQTCEGDSGPFNFEAFSIFQLQHVEIHHSLFHLQHATAQFPLPSCDLAAIRRCRVALEGLLFHPMQSDFTTCLTPKQLDAFLERAAPNRFTYIVRSPEAAGTLCSNHWQLPFTTLREDILGLEMT